MARLNRSELFDPKEVSVMHCINRAVRRAMLCGFDQYTGKSFEHRRDWVKQRLVFLAKHYGIDVLGYAVMGNHLHVILRNRPDVVKTWSDEEVATRIWYLFPKRKDAHGNPCEPKEHELNMLMASRKVIENYRSRLSDISWLMRQLAEHVAVRANKEDECTGRFWEGRFKSQPLLDEAAVLACSAYVDLNPVRAAIAQSLPESDYTSAQDRLESVKVMAKAVKAKKGKPVSPAQQRRLREQLRDSFLSPVQIAERKPGALPSKLSTRASDKGFLPMSLQAYLDLVDWTGRQLRGSKKGRIPDVCQPILASLGVDRKTWCELVKDFGKLFHRVAGKADSVSKSASQAGVGYRRSSGGPSLLSG